MLYSANLRDTVLLNPLTLGADTLKIISGYASDTMASWHIKRVSEQFHCPLKIVLIVGMSRTEGINETLHNGFKDLMAANDLPYHSTLSCQYVCEGAPVHSKMYLWERQGQPIKSFIGSANYTQTAFFGGKREIMVESDLLESQHYFQMIERDSIYCNHAEINEYITIYTPDRVSNIRQGFSSFSDPTLPSVTLSLLTYKGEIGEKSGLNWGQRAGREKNQAYIPLPVEIARTGFFPVNQQHFTVLTDDGKQLILRVEQQNDKAITTPLNNSLLGEYFRNRLGLGNGAFVSKDDLERYGRTDVTFYKLDEEQFVMDFSISSNQD